MPEAVATAAKALPWAVALPLCGALFNALFGRRLSSSLVAAVACGVMALDFWLATQAFSLLRQMPPGTAIVSDSFAWLDAGGLYVPAQLVCDAIGVTMWLVITGIGTLIHLYSWSYQKGRPGFGRYFAWLNFFVAAMVLLVLADALPVVFIGWEGVGLASWALIGFDYANLDSVKAGRKAFVVNRIGDAGFLLAMFILFGHLHTLSFAGMQASLTASAPSAAAVTAAALLLALAATGKSAQLPLYLWLPDAMAGPTPVSALIHAATMVTAGIYLLLRMGFLLALSPSAMVAIASAGAATAAFAALAASAQNDLKKVLAYSTVSQLGYMFMGVGLGAAPLALFHVTTHATFKAGLFLCAGSVIHAVGGEQDMRKLGQLGRAMPRVMIPAALCTLAIAGVPPLGGFVSKDALLTHAYALAAQGGPLAGVAQGCYAIGLGTALVTATYMGRWFFTTFASPSCRLPVEARAHLHDAPWGEAIPLWILAFLAVGIGALNWPHVLGGAGRFGHFIAGDPARWLGGQMVLAPPELSVGTECLLLVASTLAAGAGLLVSYASFGRHAPLPEGRHAHSAWSEARRAAFGYDALARLSIAVPFEVMARDVLRRFERRITSGAMLACGHLVRLSGWSLGLFHGGNVQRYLAVLVLAMALLVWGWLLPVGREALRAALQRGVA